MLKPAVANTLRLRRSCIVPWNRLRSGNGGGRYDATIDQFRGVVAVSFERVTTRTVNLRRVLLQFYGSNKLGIPLVLSVAVARMMNPLFR
jgi:hypothetical protein